MRARPARARPMHPAPGPRTLALPSTAPWSARGCLWAGWERGGEARQAARGRWSRWRAQEAPRRRGPCGEAGLGWCVVVVAVWMAGLVWWRCGWLWGSSGHSWGAWRAPHPPPRRAACCPLHAAGMARTISNTSTAARVLRAALPCAHGVEPRPRAAQPGVAAQAACSWMGAALTSTAAHAALDHSAPEERLHSLHNALWAPCAVCLGLLSRTNARAHSSSSTPARAMRSGSSTLHAHAQQQAA